MFVFYFSQNLLPLCLDSQRIVFFEQSDSEVLQIH